MRAKVEDIARFTKCPLYYHFSKDSKKLVTTRQFVIERVIKKAYLVALETGFYADWRRIIGWVDSLIFRKIHTVDSEALSAGQKLSSGILESLLKWYHELYLSEPHSAYINVPIHVTLGSHSIQQQIPIILASKIPIAYDFTTSNMPNLKYRKRDIYLAGMAYILSEVLSCDECTIRQCYISPHRAMNWNDFKYSKKELGSIYRTLVTIPPLMYAGIKYPSASADCDTCQYNKECKI